MDFKKYKEQILKEIKKEGSFGYDVPKNHPDNELNQAQIIKMAKVMKACRQLVKEGRIELIQDDRRISVFEYIVS